MKQLTITDLEKEYNSSPRESERLLKLCGDDINKLREVYYRSKLIYHMFKVPSNEEELKNLLAISLNVEHIKTGLKGKLIPYYYINSTKFGSREYGCVWNKCPEKGLLYFWQNRFNFKLI